MAIEHTEQQAKETGMFHVFGGERDQITLDRSVMLNVGLGAQPRSVNSHIP